MKKSLFYCLLMAIVLVTFTESCQDSAFQTDDISTNVINYQDITVNGLNDESAECVYDVDLSKDEHF